MGPQRLHDACQGHLKARKDGGAAAWKMLLPHLNGHIEVKGRKTPTVRPKFQGGTRTCPTSNLGWGRVMG